MANLYLAGVTALAVAGIHAVAVAQPATPPAGPNPAAAPEAAPAGTVDAGNTPIERSLPDRPGATGKNPVVAGGLTADDVARRAVASSATLRARLAEIDVAEAKVRQTTIQFFPRLTVKATYTRLSPVASDFGSGALVGAGNPGLLSTGPCPTGAGTCVLDATGQPVGAAQFSIDSLQDNYTVTASLIVPISDYVLRLSHASAASRASRSAASLSAQAEKQRVKADARALYYAWLRSHGRLAASSKALEQIRARLKDARAAYTLGTISRADLMRLESLVANTELIVHEADTVKQLTEVRLRLVMQDSTKRAYAIGEDMTKPLKVTVRGSLAQLTQRAVSRRLELRALTKTARALSRGSKGVRAGQWPRLDAFGDFTYANPNPRYFPPQRQWNATWAVGLSATWTVNDTFGNGALADELGASLRAVQAQKRALSDGIRQEVAAAYLERSRSKAAIRTSTRALKSAAEGYRVATDLYRVGRATTTELIGAESDLLQARLGYADAHIARRLAEVRLRHAIGDNI